jgi:transmembrane sensor
MGLFGKSRARIRREAADWVARLAGGADEEDRERFRRWHDADPRHAEAYVRIAGIWKAAGRLPSRSGAQDAAPAPSERGPFRLALAASLVAILAAAMLLLLAARGSVVPAAELLVLATEVGEVRLETLPDGSRLTLDSTSRIEARFTGTERQLRLIEGRVRFAVADDERPFIVRAAGSEVRATGTLFDVSLIGGRTVVLLLEGAAEVRGGRTRGARAAQRLGPGQKLVLAGGSPPVRERITRADTVWPMRMIEFDDTPLFEVAALANRYSRVQLKLGGGSVGTLRVTGTYRAGDVAGLARSLAAMFDLRLETLEDGSFLLTRTRRHS